MFAGLALSPSRHCWCCQRGLASHRILLTGSDGPVSRNGKSSWVSTSSPLPASCWHPLLLSPPPRAWPAWALTAHSPPPPGRRLPPVPERSLSRWARPAPPTVSPSPPQDSWLVTLCSAPPP